ncbi:hypothetical protein TNCT_562391 [Trichonephila clavata]|uniref:Uncharacterized protein n=2 Tax=Trichonephila clavata TaxID=2740835 RepID=A0A8X6JBR0_TRICU|nr:hypothetical protein TNCT_562391 [Trichonephila clavata]
MEYPDISIFHGFEHRFNTLKQGYPDISNRTGYPDVSKFAGYPDISTVLLLLEGNMYELIVSGFPKPHGEVNIFSTP